MGGVRNCFPKLFPIPLKHTVRVFRLDRSTLLINKCTPLASQLMRANDANRGIREEKSILENMTKWFRIVITPRNSNVTNSKRKMPLPPNSRNNLFFSLKRSKRDKLMPLIPNVCISTIVDDRSLLSRKEVYTTAMRCQLIGRQSSN